MRLSLTRTVGFRAAHRFHRPDWSAEENRARFGAVGEAPGHSHDYRCAVTVTGPMEPGTDTIVDLVALDALLHERIVQPLDGQHINLVLPEFAYGKELPSCEALARYFFRRIGAGLPAGVRLVRVRVAEDEALFAECADD